MQIKVPMKQTQTLKLENTLRRFSGHLYVVLAEVKLNTMVL